jgi:plastocyanin
MRLSSALVRRIGLALLAVAALCASAVPAWSGDEDRQPPTAALSVSPQPVVAGEGAVLDGSGSRDPDGSVVSYAWDLDGDGSFETGGGAEARLAHVFEQAGSFQVGLRVVDATGATGDASTTVTVQAPPEPEPAPEPPPSPKAAAEPQAADRAASRERTRAASEPERDEEPAREEPKRRPRAQSVRAAASTTVSIRDFSFAPRTVTVNAGDTVTWRNTGDEPHTATGAGFDTGTLRTGQSGSHTFPSPGNFSYKCTPHPFMTGTVRVVASGSGGSGGGSGGSGGGTQGAENDGGAGGGTTGGGEADAGGGDLPSTGLALGPIALAGLAMIGAGVALRRRVAWPAA